MSHIDPKQVALARQLYTANQVPNEQIWTMLQVSEATFYRLAKIWRREKAASMTVPEQEPQPRV